MKLNQLKQIIREEIVKVVREDQKYEEFMKERIKQYRKSNPNTKLTDEQIRAEMEQAAEDSNRDRGHGQFDDRDDFHHLMSRAGITRS